jgi:hypothetical protein
MLLVVDTTWLILDVAVVLKCLLWTTAAILCKVCDCVPWVWWWLMDEGCRRPGPWLFRVAQHMTCFLCVGCLCRILWGWSGLLGVKEVRHHLVRSGLPPFSNARFIQFSFLSFFLLIISFRHCFCHYFWLWYSSDFQWTATSQLWVIGKRIRRYISKILVWFSSFVISFHFVCG